ncbi:MAG TPA: serine protease [Thermoanaerobaculia bacterium]|nr:serine protease [Thermoanaerobaculia bacterium]
MNLTADERNRLFDAIVESYSIAELRRLLLLRIDHPVGQTLQRVSGADTLDDVVVDIFEHSKRHGWFDQLIIALRESRPQVQFFRDLSARIVPPAIDRGEGRHLQQEISKQIPALKPVHWRAVGEATERRVCLIDITTKDGYVIDGTGFLVAADLILTARHVIAPAIADDGKAARAALENVEIWFDRKHLEDGTTLSTGTRFRLHNQDWHIASDVDLDYALLRLDAAAGNLPLGLKRIEEGAPRRCWIELPQPPVNIQPDMPLIIPQHAEGEPLTLAMETQSVIGLPDGPRVVHTTNTDYGASGAPCFDLSWNLVAMHVAALDHPKANEAVAITAIVDSLRDKGIAGIGLPC